MRPTPERLRRTLAEIDRSDLVRPIDLALARLLGSIDAEHEGGTARSASVGLAAAVASVMAREGNSLVSLDAVAGAPFPGEATGHELLPVLPGAEVWREHLAASPVVGTPGDATPLLLDGDRLALARFWHAEGRVASDVAGRMKEGRGARGSASSTSDPALSLNAPIVAPSDSLRALFVDLFPPRGDGAPVDWQAVAAVTALRTRILFVAGGPGTGKTYTAARLLAVLRAAYPGLDVALAAPTGKAAQRLGSSFADAIADLPDAVADTLSACAPVTLHTLLGMRHSGTPRFGAGRPLPHDLVLVDEGSMVSLEMFDRLLAALAPDARLVVLGDPDQLESVEAGAVFGDVCALGAGPGSAEHAAHCAAFGHAVPSTDTPSPFADAVVTLTESRRFTPASGVGRLAAALREGDASSVGAVLAEAPDARAVETDSAEAAVEWAAEGAVEVVRAGTPTEALNALGKRQLLAAVRRGAYGIEGLNAGVEVRLRAADEVRYGGRGEPFYRNRPLLVTENRHADGLANGDIGVCGWADGARVVHFPDGAGGTRAVPLGQLPPTEPAWALTIHKSQGSEFDAVGVVLPDPKRQRRPLSRELLYTAVTRARCEVVVFGSAAEAADAAARPSARQSALRERLAEALS